MLWPRPFVLRRDADQWQLVQGSKGPAMAGEVQIALDFGAWLLLRFVPDTAGGRSRWLAVQRRGLEPHWHALRCAVYAPHRKQPAAGASADG